MTHYHFEIEHAKKYGLSEAVLIQNFRYWINQNKANEKNFHDGRYWTFNTVSAYTALFPFFSKKQIENILKSLIDQGVLIKGNYNQSTYDRTCWYAFVNESEFLMDIEKEKCISPNGEMEFAKRGNGFPQKGKPIPDNKPYIKQNRDKSHMPEEAKPVRQDISFSFDSFEFEGIEQKDLDKWKDLYPSVDILKELKKMSEWCQCNQRRAKSKKQWRKFIVIWLSKCNEESINKEAYQKNKNQSIDRARRDESGKRINTERDGLF